MGPQEGSKPNSLPLFDSEGKDGQKKEELKTPVMSTPPTKPAFQFNLPKTEEKKSESPKQPSFNFGKAEPASKPTFNFTPVEKNSGESKPFVFTPIQKNEDKIADKPKPLG